MYKVVGLGDSGIDILKLLVANKRKRFLNIKCIAINTHAAAFLGSPADRNLLLNNSGLGAAGDPMKGKNAAEASKDMLFEALGYAERIYITCGMGGGTGTGAAYVVAYVAKELKIPTTAIVSMPFIFEGTQRKRVAELGIRVLNHFADEVIVINSDKEVRAMRKQNAPVSSEFAGAMPYLGQSFNLLSTYIVGQIFNHIAKDSAAKRS